MESKDSDSFLSDRKASKARSKHFCCPSTMAPPSRLLHFFFFGLIFFSLLLGGRAQSFQTFKVSSLGPAKTCSSPPTGDNDNGRLRVVDQQGPCSPFARVRVRDRQILLRDQLRVDLIHSKMSEGFSLQPQSQAATVLPAKLGAPFGIQNYIVTVGFGTPAKNLTVVFDTGSDLTWIQCRPCSVNCYSQRDPIFDPFQSTSYVNVTCGSAACAQLASATGGSAPCEAAACRYSVAYGDGSKSSGFFAREVLTLTGASDAIFGFEFGCGQDNEGIFGVTAGILGLGRGRVSAVSQTAKRFKGFFSYCLPSSTGSAGYLRFGGKAGAGAGISFTAMKANSRAPSFYFLELVGITVGGEDIGVAASVYSSPGTIIDSGTVITQLQPAAYVALRSAFRRGMSNYSMAPPYMQLDTCFNFTGLETVAVPRIALRFSGGATLPVHVTGMFYHVRRSQVCLAFAGNKRNDSIGIVGNRQQRTINVVYDVAGARIGFGAGGCGT